MSREIVLRAMRRMGEMLKKMDKHPGVRGRFAGGSKAKPPEESRKLKDFGIEKTEAHRAQKIARIAATRTARFSTQSGGESQ